MIPFLILIFLIFEKASIREIREIGKVRIFLIFNRCDGKQEAGEQEAGTGIKYKETENLKEQLLAHSTTADLLCHRVYIEL